MANLVENLELERCPHCRVHRPHLGQFWGPGQTTTHDGKPVGFWSTYKCNTCGGIVLAKAPAQRAGVTALYPSGDINLSPAIPSRAQDYLRQAADSLHAPSASVVVSASAVDAMLKAKGYRDRSLYTRIEKAAADHLITQEMAAWAHDVRLDANDERHADEDAPLPSQADAQRCLDFALSLAQFLFVLPEQVRRGREAAAQK